MQILFIIQIMSGSENIGVELSEHIQQTIDPTQGVMFQHIYENKKVFWFVGDVKETGFEQQQQQHIQKTLA